MNRKTLLLSATVTGTFLVAFYGGQVMSNLLPLSFSSPQLHLLYFYSWWLLPTLGVTAVLFGPRAVGEVLGLDRGLGTGLLFAAATTVPMWIGAATTGQLTGEVDAFALVRGTLVAGFMEELLFRGFLFGLLFRKAGWGFVPAALLGGILFGMGHLYQGHSLGEALGVFLVTALGGGWFAWLYVEWNYNLWVPIWLHVCMNLVWMLFELGDNALGGWLPNLFRALTIALTIVVTLRWHATRGRRITRRNLWVNRDAA